MRASQARARQQAAGYRVERSWCSVRRVGQARKRDGNERDIIAALENHGIIVVPVSGVGCPDLLCYSPLKRIWLPVEVKTKAGKLTPSQVKLQRVAAYPVVRSVTEALNLFREL